MKNSYSTSRTTRKDHFVSKATGIHGDRYDYSKVEYHNAHTKVTIICPEHGPFDIVPDAHTSSKGGCVVCSRRALGKRQQKPIETLLAQFTAVHGTCYGYEKVQYTNNKTKIIVTCKKHGDFKTKPSHHLNGHGCDRCAREKSNWTRFAYGSHSNETALL
jgi:hypothetical protein